MIRTCALTLAILASSVLANLELTWSTVDGGGIINAVGGDFTLSGTIGQPDAGVATGGKSTLIGGFWGVGGCNGFVPVDFDQDCDVDFGDLLYLDACASGPANLVTSGCLHADLDQDGDIDQFEFAVWQRCFSGDNVPADPLCAN